MAEANPQKLPPDSGVRFRTPESGRQVEELARDTREELEFWIQGMQMIPMEEAGYFISVQSPEEMLYSLDRYFEKIQQGSLFHVEDMEVLERLRKTLSRSPKKNAKNLEKLGEILAWMDGVGVMPASSFG